MALTPDELDALVKQAGNALQAIQNEYGIDNVPDARVRFPRGFIRTAESLRRGLPNLGTDLQRRNASYTLMTSDLLRWLVVRTDLAGPAVSLVVKEAICILGAICEWLTKEATRGHASSRPYKERTRKLVDLGIISADLKNELDWTWDIRCNEHLNSVTSLECHTYTREDYNRAFAGYTLLRDALTQIHGRAA